MRIVLDTGIFISALISEGTPPDKVYQAWLDGAFVLITSEAQLTELKRVLGYEKLQRYLKAPKVAILLESIEMFAVLAEKLPEVDLSPDPDDNRIIATAIAGKADYIISGDKRHMLSLEKAEGIPIVTARYAVDTLFSGE